MIDELEKYKHYLMANGMSHNTIKKYIYNISYFLKQYNVNTITEEEIQKYIIELQKTKERTTVNNYLASLKSFLFEFKRLNIRIPKMLKTEDKAIDYIDDKDFLNKVLFELEMSSSDYAKPKAILCLMYDTGLRPSDIVKLRRTDFDFEKDVIFLRIQKSKKEITIPFTTNTKYLLQAYFLFDVEKNNAFNITVSGITGIFARLKKKLPNLKLRPCLLRHSCCTNLLEKGLPIEQVAYILGHKNIQTTLKHYAKIKEENILANYKKKINQERWDR